MNPIKIVLKILKYLGLGLSVVALILAMMSVFGIALPLNFLKGSIEDAARDALGRELNLKGNVGLIPGLSPELSLQDVELTNPSGWKHTDFASAIEVRTQIHLLPLLEGKIHIGQAMLRGVQIDLVQPDQGAANWYFDLTSGDQSASNQNERKDRNKPIQLPIIDGIQLSEIVVSYSDESTPAQYDLKLDKGYFQLPEGESAMLEVEGILNTLPFSLSAAADPIQNLSEPPLLPSLKIDSSLGSTRLDATIDFDEDAINVSAELNGQNLDQLGQNLGFTLPAIQRFTSSISANYTKKTLRVDTLNTTFDDSTVDASLMMDHEGRPLKLSGVIDIGSFDLDPFLQSPDDKEVDATDQTLSQTESEQPSNSADLSNLAEKLSDFEVDLDVRIGQLHAGNTVVSDSNLKINLKDGEFNTPISLILNDVPVNGRISLLGKNDTVTASATIEAENQDIGDLEQWFNLEGIDGSIGRLSLSAEASGKSLQSMRDSLAANLIIEGAQLNYRGREQAQTVDLTINELSANVAEQKPLAIDVEGILLEEGFTINITGGRLLQLFKGEEWPVSVNASGAGAELNIDGVVRTPTEKSGSDLSISLIGANLGDMHNWLGVKKDATAKYQFIANAKTHRAGWEVSSYEIGLGDTVVKGKVIATRDADDTLFDVGIFSNLINIVELNTIFTDPEPAPNESENQKPRT
ncbi:MAG: AsmA family protein, partial [bacterium]